MDIDSPQTKYIYDVIEYEFERKKFDEQEKINEWKTLHNSKNCKCTKLLEIEDLINKINIECDFETIYITPKFKYNNFISLFLDCDSTKFINILSCITDDNSNSTNNLKIIIQGFRIHSAIHSSIGFRIKDNKRKLNYFINKSKRLVENEHGILNIFKQHNIECHILQE